jgi:hypothetical protein
VTAHLDVVLQRERGNQPIACEVDNLVIAGWTGREKASVDRHIAELARLGVKPPASTPVFYRASVDLLTHATRIQVVGPDSSGEVEFFIVSTPAGPLIGVGSDHTDREVEAYDITVSKQMCAKPVGANVWLLSDVIEHWDSLVLEAHLTRKGERMLYQRGTLDAMLAPHELIRRYMIDRSELPVGTLMFGGTIPVIGDIDGGERFEIALVDPLRKRRLEHAYDTEVLWSVEAR